MRALTLLFIAGFALSACTTTKVLTPKPKPSSKSNISQGKRHASIVIDTRSGRVLHSIRPDAKRFPASLTKMMTLYLLFEAIDSRRLSKGSRIPVSRRAANQPASKLWLKPGSSISAVEAIQALAVVSANDVAYAVAEKLGGSEAGFARRMTRKARALGMRSTTFKNASGLPNRRQVTTARDMAKLGAALKRKFPHHFHYFARRSMKFRGKTRRGHNRVLGQLRGANGIKTGYTRASGFNLVTSVRRGGRTYIGVVMGENSGRVRDRKMVKMMKRALKR